MAAKRRALLLAIASLLASTAAVASIPRSTALDPPAFDRFALDARERDDNDTLLDSTLDRALPHQASIALLSETRVRGSEVFVPLLHEERSALNRALGR